MKFCTPAAIYGVVFLTACVAPANLTSFGKLPDREVGTSILLVPASGNYGGLQGLIGVVGSACRAVDLLPFTDGTLVTPLPSGEVVVSTPDTVFRRHTSLPLRTQLFETPATDYVGVVSGRASAGRVQQAAVSISSRVTGELIYTLEVLFTPSRPPAEAERILAIKLAQAMGREPQAAPRAVNKYGLPAEYLELNVRGS